MAATLNDDRRDAAEQSIYQRRFVAAITTLAVIAAVGLGVAVWLAERGKPRPWSTLTTATITERGQTIEKDVAEIDDPVERAQAVASLVESRYLGDNDRPLVTISAGEDVLSDLPGRDQVVAIASGETGPPISFEYGNIVFFNMCGRGTRCQFDRRPAALPGRVVALASRQAKELALRGLKYVPEADAAIITLPGGMLESEQAGTDPPTVVYYYRRDALKEELDRPLHSDFESVQPTPKELAEETALIMFRNYADRLFAMTAKPNADGTAVIYEMVPFAIAAGNG